MNRQPPIPVPTPLTDAQLNIPAPVAPANPVTADDVYASIQYRKAIDAARGVSLSILTLVINSGLT